MIRTPPRPPIRADKILIVLALGPLLCWLPLLVLDSLQSHRQRPHKAQAPATMRPTAVGAARAVRPIQQRQSNPSATARTLARSRPAAQPARSQARPQIRPAPSPTISSKLPAVVPKAKRPAASPRRSQFAHRQHHQRQRQQQRQQQRQRQRQRKPAAAPLAHAILTSIKPKAPSGAMLLGNLDLSSLEEKPMLTAARLERSTQLASPDPLSVVPKALKPTFLATIPKGERVIPAEVVRLPAPHLQAPEQIPLLLHPSGRAQGPTTFRSAVTQQRVESWVARQPAVASGSVRPVVLKLEPLAPSSPRPAARPRHAAKRVKAPRAAAPRTKAPRTIARAQRRQLRGSASQRSGPRPAPLTPNSLSLDLPSSSAGPPSPAVNRLPQATPSISPALQRDTSAAQGEKPMALPGIPSSDP